MINNNAAYAAQRSAFLRQSENSTHEFATLADPKLRTRIKLADAYIPRIPIKGILVDETY